jgi:hypothetical protein
MNAKSLWKFVPPAGPVLSLLLIGLLLLSALVYYRAVRIQRFLEPALAMSQPRNEFAESVNQAFRKEFGPGPFRSLKATSNAILIERGLLFTESGALTPAAPIVLKKLARIFLALLGDNRTRPDISLVLISGRYPAGRPGRVQAQQMAGLVQDFLFLAEPELGSRYRLYFAAAVQPAHHGDRGGGVIELRIIPSELLHIEVLQKLEKYAR